MKKRIAIVTGATGGIGKEFVRALCKEKLDEIYLVGRSLEKMTALQEELRKEIEGNSPVLAPLPLDLTREDDLSVFRTWLSGQQAAVCYLINNAGIASAKASKDFSDDEIAKTVGLNCTAPTILTNICITYMERGSRILFLSSASSFQPVPYINLYAATKAFERSYARALNVELKAFGITVTAVCPSWVDTKLLTQERNGTKVSFPGIVTPDRVVKKAMKDAKRGKDMSVCSFYVKCQHWNTKIWPQRFTMWLWMRGIRKYRPEDWK